MSYNPNDKQGGQNQNPRKDDKTTPGGGQGGQQRGQGGQGKDTTKDKDKQW